MRIIIVGDLILDRFIRGDVRRISPEAPVPVIRVLEETQSLGGAANVAANIKSLGGTPFLIGVVGEDAHGKALRSALDDAGIAHHLVSSPSRMTTVKTRIVAHRQQVVRLDREESHDPSPTLSTAVHHALQGVLTEETGALVLSDYAKGTLGKLFWDTLKDPKIPTLVDPKPKHFSDYPPWAVLTPNQKELAGFLNCRSLSSEEIPRAAHRALTLQGGSSMAVTSGPDGILVVEQDHHQWASTEPKEVFDVTGAGDTVVAAMSLGMAAGQPLFTAAVNANVAAGIVVGKSGTATCSKQEWVKACRLHGG